METKHIKTDIRHGFLKSMKKRVGKKIQLALISKEVIKKNEIILKAEGKIVKFPTRTSFQIGKKEHLECEPIKFINHSCNPNTYINLQDLTLRALKNIKKNEELTFNYLTTEWDLANKFKCECNSKYCFKNIKGLKYLSFEKRKKIKPSISPIIK